MQPSLPARRRDRLDPPEPAIEALTVDPVGSRSDAFEGGLQRLDQLPAGSRCSVLRIVETDEALAIRLKTMGLHEGRSLRVLRAGDRLIVACGATRIGLAASLARCVLVRPQVA